MELFYNKILLFCKEYNFKESLKLEGYKNKLKKIYMAGNFDVREIMSTISERNNVNLITGIINND